MPDHRAHHSGPDPTAPSTRDARPPDQVPPLEHDLGVVEWLQCSHELTGNTTGYLCDALLQWTGLGASWPDPVEPAAGPDCDHLEALVQLHDRWLQRAQLEPIDRRLELARVGRVLGTAIRCERDPQGLAQARWREMVHLQPSLAQPPAPYMLADGRVL